MSHDLRTIGLRATLALSMTAAMAVITAPVAHAQTQAQNEARTEAETQPPAQVGDLDQVIFLTGHPLFGEIEELRRGKLEFDTEEMDVVEIDWDDIGFLTSNRIFEVTDADGDQYFGSLGPTTEEATLVVVLGQRADTLAFSDVVEIIPIATGFFKKTKGFMDLGANLARANKLASVLFKGRFAYRDVKWDLDVTGDAYFQQQETTPDDGEPFEERTTRNSLNTTAKRFFGGTWAGTAAAEIEQNEELDLDSRILLMLGGEYQIIRNRSMQFYTGAGGVLNSETFQGEEQTFSGEIALLMGFDAFDIGDLDLDTTVVAFGAPGDGGRFRLNLDGRIAWEIFDDFSIGFTVTERYDSKPPTEDAGRDFQYGLTVGWSWN